MTFGAFFLWGGFIFGCAWHFGAWTLHFTDWNEGDAVTKVAIQINFGLSGTCLCAFGYLLFR